MRFIVDECTGPSVARWLMARGNDVYAVSLESPGWKDTQVLDKANTENRILITNDRDFGELIVKTKLPHQGVIFLRLSDETPANKIAILERLLVDVAVQITHNVFITVTEESVRIRSA